VLCTQPLRRCPHPSKPNQVKPNQTKQIINQANTANKPNKDKEVQILGGLQILSDVFPSNGSGHITGDPDFELAVAPLEFMNYTMPS
jgi:hypothetical protein